MADLYTAPASGVPYTQAGAPITPYVPDNSFIPSPSATPVDNRWEITKGFARGVDNLQAMGFGALGLGADLVGADQTKEYFFNKALEQQKQAEEAPAAVSQFTDAWNSGDFSQGIDWFMGAVGEALPSSAMSLMTGGAGAVLFKQMAGKLATNALAQAATKRLAQKYVADGVAKSAQEAAEMAVKKYFGAELGAYAGAMASGSAMESGSNWIDDAQTHGLQNTAPGRDLLFGLAGGAVEAGLGAERRLIGSALRDKTAAELTKLAGRKGITNLAAGLGKGMASEGAEEFTQQALSQAAGMQDVYNPAKILADQDWKSNFNAGMAGAAGGFLFGTYGGAKNAMAGSAWEKGRAAREQAELAQQSTDWQNTYGKKYAIGRTTPSDTTNTTADTVKNEYNTVKTILSEDGVNRLSAYDAQLEQIGGQRSTLLNQTYAVGQREDLDPQTKQSTIEQLTQQFMEATAAETKLKTEREQYHEEFTNKLKKTDEKYQKSWTEAMASDMQRMPSNAQEAFAMSVAKQQDAKAQAVIDRRATAELDKARERVRQHRKALYDLNSKMTGDTAQSTAIDYDGIKLRDWHEKKIAEEQKYIDKLDKAYNTASEDKRSADALFSLYRDDNHALNEMQQMYGATLEGMQKATEAAPKASSTSRGMEVLRKRLEDNRNAMAQRQVGEMQRGNQLVRDMAARRDITAGVMPGVLPYSERSTEYTQNTPIAQNNMFAGEQEAGVFSNQAASLRARLNAKQEEKRARMLEQQTKMLAKQEERRAAELKKQNEDSLYRTTAVDPKDANVELQKRQVVSWISGTLDLLKNLKNVVKIVHSSEMAALPDYIRKEYKGGEGVIDLKEGKIYIVADKINSKQRAVRVLLHESVAHFGLRSIMTPEQLDKFLHMVARDFVGSKSWKDLAALYPEYDQVSLAEEYVAKFAEQLYFDNQNDTIGFGKKDGPYRYKTEEVKTIYEKIKKFFRNLLQQLGFVSVSEQDIREVILASAYNLSKRTRANNIKGHTDSNTKDAMLAVPDKLKEWFGDSKIVDSNGYPLVVYHGSPEDFSTFKLSKDGSLGSGIYVTPDETYAADYTGIKSRTPLALYARVTNPLVISMDGVGVYPEVLILEQLGMPRDKAMILADKVYDEKGGFTKELMARARNFGFDGFVVNKNGAIQEIVVFNSAQLKSADKNSGEYNPYNKNIYESRSSAPSGEYETVRTTPAYKSWFGKSLDKLSQQFTLNSGNVEDGKINLANEQSLMERLMIGAADSMYTLFNVEELVRQAGGVLDEANNPYKTWTLMHNVVSKQVNDFLSDTIGINPQNSMAAPTEGTLLWKMTRLSGKDNIPTDPRQLLEVFGDILQAWHAPEANRVLAERSIDKKQLKAVEDKISDLEHKLSLKNSTVKQVEEMERKLQKYKDLKQNIIDVRQDLYGMSNEKAAQIRSKYETSQNALAIQEIVNDVQKINKQILDKAVAEGLLDPEVRAFWDATYAYYVPNKKFQETMAKISPSYNRGGRVNLGVWELSKERMGSDEEGANPIVQLILKMEDVIKVAEEKKFLTSFSNMVEANPTLFSDLIEKDNRPEVLAYSRSLKEVQADINRLLSDEKVRNSRQMSRDLRKKIKELELRKAKWENRYNLAETDGKILQAQKMIDKINADITSAYDAIDVLQQHITQTKELSEYAELKQKQRSIIEARKALYAQRGLSRYVENGVIKVRRNPSKFTGKMDRVVTLFDKDGNKRRYLIKNDHLLAALRGTHMMKVEMILRVLGAAQRVMAQLMTTYNPAFWMVNFFRDNLTAIIHARQLTEDIPGLDISRWDMTKKLFFANMPKTVLRELYKNARGGTMDPYWAAKLKAFEELGGSTTMYNIGSFGTTEKMLEKTLDSNAKPKQAMFAVMNYMSDVSGAIENSNRLAAFAIISDELVKSGRSPEVANKIAAEAALELTVNFTKKGTWGPVLSSLFLFSQASINSTVRIMRAMFPESDAGKGILVKGGWKDQRRAVRYGAGLMATAYLLASAARALGGDDDDGIPFYDKLPDYVKNNNIIIAIGKNKFIKLPMTFGYAMPWAMGSVALDVINGKSGISRAMAATFDSMLQNFFIVGGGDEGITALTPTLFKPLVQIYSNKNYFGGEVYPEAKSWEKGTKPDSQKSWKATSPLFAKAATALNAFFGGNTDRAATWSWFDISPASMEYAFKQYTGGVGDLALKTAGLANVMMFGKDRKMTFNDFPIVNRFSAESTYQNTLHAYAAVKNEIETQLKEYDRAKAEKVNTGELALVFKDTRAGRLMKGKLDTVQKHMANVSKLENKLMANPNVADETKYNTRLRNEEKNEQELKMFIKAARMAGVKPK